MNLIIHVDPDAIHTEQGFTTNSTVRRLTSQPDGVLWPVAESFPGWSLETCLTL